MRLSGTSRKRQDIPARKELSKLWRSLWRECLDHYRPELHYMRGPGPRWREKHRRASA
jgi:hypothetical protein